MQEILGYTELHPEVVQKMLDLYKKVEGHDMRMNNLTEIVNELKGLSLWEIERMINRKKDEMLSSIEENTQYVKEIENSLSQLTYRLDHISLEESK